MNKNMGKTDVRMRIIAALLIVLLYFAQVITGTVAIVLLVVAGVFALTSALRFCPLYTLFGISTNKAKHRE